MGVDYTPVLYVGKQFDDQDEAKDFLVSNGWEFSENDLAYIEEENLEEFLYGSNKLQSTVLNCYNGWGFVLGFELSANTPGLFLKNYEEAVDKWVHLFPTVVPDIVHEVCVS